MSEDESKPKAKWFWIPAVADPSAPTSAELDAGVPVPGLGEYTFNPREASEDDRWERLRNEGATLVDHEGKAIGIVLPADGPDEDGCYTAGIIPDPFYNDPK